MAMEYRIIENANKALFEQEMSIALNEGQELVSNLKIIRTPGLGILYYHELVRHTEEN